MRYIPYRMVGKYESMVSMVSIVGLPYILTILDSTALGESVGEGIMRCIPNGAVIKYVSMVSKASILNHPGLGRSAWEGI